MSEFIETFGAKKKRDRKGYLKRKLEAARQDSAVGADEIREAEELFLRPQKRQRITNDEKEEMEEKEDAIADAQPLEEKEWLHLQAAGADVESI